MSEAAHKLEPQSHRWRIRVGTTDYGPYAAEQMKTYIAEGRVLAHSLVMREGTQGWIQAGQDPWLGPLFASAKSNPAAAERKETDAVNYVLVVDIRSRSSTAFDQAVLELGRAYKLAPNVWLVNTTEPLGTVRNTLIQHLGRTDTLFVVDATHDKTAWHNFGPEVDAKVRHIWRKA